MSIADYFSIAIISIIWIASFFAFRRGGRFPLPAVALQSGAKWGFAFFTFGIIIILIYNTYVQFITWRAHEISKYFIPPHNSINYFLFYVGMRLWLPYAISFTAGLLAFGAAVFLNKRFGGRFFEQEEPYYIAMGFFVSGHPGWIAYGVLFLAAYLLFSVFHVLFYRETRRLSFYYGWLPLAALAIALNTVLMNYHWYNNFII